MEGVSAFSAARPRREQWFTMGEYTFVYDLRTATWVGAPQNVTADSRRVDE